MTLNLERVLANPLFLISGAVLLMLIKTVLIALIGWRGGKLKKLGALRLGLLLSQGGEFGFVIFSMAGQLQLLDKSLHEQLIAIITISMVLTPIAVFLFEKTVMRFAHDSHPAFDEIDDGKTGVVIAGFGRFGQISGRVLASLRIPFTALDINPEQVSVVRRFGNKVHYGDASQLDMLHAARVGDAKVLILAIDDIDASLRTARLVQQDFPDVRILARARNRRHAHLLMDAGVTWMVRENYHSSLLMAEEMLVGIGRERKEAQELIQLFRDADESTLIRQHGLHNDPDKILQSAKEAADELRELFEEDQRSRDRS